MLIKGIAVRVICVCSIDILLATEICGNAHEDLKLSFGDSYDDYDNDSINVTVTEHSSRDKVNANDIRAYGHKTKRY